MNVHQRQPPGPPGQAEKVYPMKFKKVAAGLATYVPGLRNRHIKGTGGTASPRYCYSIWLRHLVMARENGLDTAPAIVAELGPGDSIGIGLAALLTGAEKYYALDVVEHADIGGNLAVFDGLVALFRGRSGIPGTDEWPNIKPLIDDLGFPAAILDEDRLAAALAEDRLSRIRASIHDWRSPGSMIEYHVPWHDAGVLENESVGMIYSQAVLEHVNDLPLTYAAMHEWLKPNGVMSHAIDYKSHGTADEWNGHWRYPRILWRMLRGRRPYLINRQPHSAHVKLMAASGFDIVHQSRYEKPSPWTVSQLAREFHSLSDEDLVTAEGFIQCIKRQT